MSKKISYFFKVLGLFILMATFSSIPVEILGLNVDNFSNLETVIYYLIMDILFIIILVLAYRKTLLKDLKDFFSDFLNNFEKGFKYWLVGFLIMIVSNLIIVNITGGIASNEEAVREALGNIPIYMMFSIMIYAPFTEELIFRKGIRDFINNKWIYILVSGLVFGGLHVLPLIKSSIDLLHLIPYCALGISFASLYYKTNNIFSSMMMHFLHNTLALFVLTFFNGGI